MTRCILITLITFLCYSCKERIPSYVLPPPEMQNVLWDLMRADALSEQLVRNDSAKTLASESSALRRQVLQIHKIKEVEFAKSYAYYSQHPNIFKDLLDSINSQQIRMSTIEIPVQKNLGKDRSGK